MAAVIKKDSKISIAAACFSMYAYKELKKQLDMIEECRFIFTSPTFVKEKAEKQKREFYIPRLSTEDYPGCPYCKATTFVICGTCGKLNCYNGSRLFSCGWCGVHGVVSLGYDGSGIRSSGDR